MLIGLMPMQLTHVHVLYYYLGHTYQYDGRIMNRSCLWQWSLIITLLRWSYQFGLVASLGGRHHWETLSSRLFSHLFHIPHIQTVPLFTVQYCYLNTRLLQSGKPPVFPRVAQGFVCWVFMQPRRLELPVLVPLCS